MKSDKELTSFYYDLIKLNNKIVKQLKQNHTQQYSPTSIVYSPTSQL